MGFVYLEFKLLSFVHSEKPWESFCLKLKDWNHQYFEKKKKKRKIQDAHEKLNLSLGPPRLACVQFLWTGEFRLCTLLGKYKWV